MVVSLVWLTRDLANLMQDLRMVARQPGLHSGNVWFNVGSSLALLPTCVWWALLIPRMARLQSYGHRPGI